MITPEYLTRVVQATEKRVADMNTMLTRQIVDRILTFFERTGDVEVNPASVYDVMKQVESGKVMDDVVDEIARQMPAIQNEVKSAFQNAAESIGQQNLEFYQEVAKVNNIDVDIPKEVTLSKSEKNILDSYYKRTNGEIKNLTKTTASRAQQAFIETIDKATFNAQHGMGREDAICNAIDDLAIQGVTTVHYASGRTDRIEVAVARAVRTGINMANADMWLTGCAESGVDYVLTSSHLGARVTGKGDYTDHSRWQGKVYKLDWSNSALKGYNHTESKPTFRTKIRNALLKSGIKKDYPDFVQECGYGQMLGICGINCRHTFSAFYPGMKNNNIQYDSAENKKRYEQEQRQRAYERKIREYERRDASFEQITQCGDESLAQTAQKRRTTLESRMRDLRKEYNKYCNDNKLPKQAWRLKTTR